MGWPRDGSIGGLEQGYAAMKLNTSRGADFCFASYRPGTYTVGDLKTDALQSQVVMDGAQVRSMYLGGGTTLSYGVTSLQRSIGF